jgi:hypothetical protein
MVDQFQFEIIVGFYCSTCNCTREEKTTVSTPVAEPLFSELCTLSSQQDRKCPVCGSRIAAEEHFVFRPALALSEPWPSELPFRWNRELEKPSRQTAKELLRNLASGSSDVYETYRDLYHLWRKPNLPVEELQPLFTIPGIEPDGQLSVTEQFKSQLRTSAIAILATLPD